MPLAELINQLVELLDHGLAVKRAVRLQNSLALEQKGPEGRHNLLVEVSPGTRFGASYRSQVSHRVEGSATFNVPAPLATSPVFQNTPARADLKTPDVVSLAGSHEVSPQVTLLAQVQWTNWSVVKNLRIERPDGSARSSGPGSPLQVRS